MSEQPSTQKVNSKIALLAYHVSKKSVAKSQTYWSQRSKNAGVLSEIQNWNFRYNQKMWSKNAEKITFLMSLEIFWLNYRQCELD